MAQKKTKKATKKKTTAGKKAAAARKKSAPANKSARKAVAAKKAKKAVVKKRIAKKVVTKKATAGKKTALKTAKKVTKKVVKKVVKKTPKKAVKKTAKKTTKKSIKKVTGKALKPRVKAVAKKKAIAKSPRRVAARSSKPKWVPTPAVRPDPLAALSLVPAKKAQKLKKQDLGQYRALLLEKRAQLVGDVSTLQSQALSDSRQEAAGDLSSMPIHMADLGSDNYEKEFTLGLIESERMILREIDEALQRIDDGTYGICQATGRPIGKARLKAQPWVKHCYEYVLALEKGQLSSGF